MPEIWLRTDEYEEAVSSLEFATEEIGQVSEDLYRWKWIILSLHNAVQGFMVISLRGTNGLRVLKDDVAKAWLKAHEAGEPLPEEKLDSFLNLYKKTKNGLSNGVKFKPVGTQGRSIKKLDSLRDELIHFTPKGWSLEVSGLPGICIDCFAIIRFLAFESGAATWYEEEFETRARNALKSVEEAMKPVESLYAKELRS